MATKKKMLEAAAGTAAAGGASLDITDVFSTYLYDGTGSALTITNGIDLGEGGLTWIKKRNAARSHVLYDTERGATFSIASNGTSAQGEITNGLTSFNSNGFTTGNNAGSNENGETYASWTFRKAPKFFDCVTYTGTGVAKAIAHNLGSVPGMIIVKNTSNTANWRVYHRSTGELGGMVLNDTSAFADFAGYWNDVSPTDTEFTVGWNNEVNADTQTYVAYLFAHNDSGDGEFGPDGDQDIIKCGSFNSGGSAADVDVNLGFEPQFVMFKPSSAGGGWYMYDTMRGIVTGGNDALLFANASSAETVTGDYIDVTSTGFKFTAAGWNGVTGPNKDLIYMAIRRGPLAPPTAGTEVFAIDTMGSTGDGKEPGFRSGFPVDMQIYTKRSGLNKINSTRLNQGKYLLCDSTVAEAATSSEQFDYNNGFYAGTSTFSTYISWMWKRAPSFCDVVCYTGTGSSSLTLNHNLGVVPEMMWVKRKSGTSSWKVYHKDLTNTNSFLYINSTAAEDSAQSNVWPTAPTATQLTIGNYTGDYTGGGDTGISYLFASLDGVSKVSSYTGNGSSQTINAGFTTGARYILIKRTDSTGDWYVWDSLRGIVAGNDPHLSLNTNVAEVTSDDSIDPDSSGFIVNQVAATNINVSSATYIYYAVA